MNAALPQLRFFEGLEVASIVGLSYVPDFISAAQEVALLQATDSQPWRTDLKRRVQHMTQATAPKIKEKWGKKITVEKSSRKIDFAINTPQKLFLIEVNFYGGGGSKLKSTAGEYKSDFKRWKADGHEFIWITDGVGWRSTHLPLRERTIS